MAYNPFKKLDELKFYSTGGSTPTNSYNPNNYSSVMSSQKNTVTKPNYQYDYPIGPTQTKTTTQTPSTPSYLGTYQTTSNTEKQQAADRLARAKSNVTASYDERNRLLQESIPQLQAQFTKAQQYFDTGNVNAQNKANMAKENIDVETGSAQRQNAETLRTGQANIANRFAGLNTTDSYGAGSHMQAQENVQSDFNRLTAENLRQKEQNKAAIDQQLLDYQISAQKELDGLKSTLDTTIMQIQSSMRLNDIDKQNAIDSAIADYEDKLNGIDTAYNNILKDYQLKQLELEKTSLSPEFMKTGVPQNENDYKFLVENSDKYDKYGGLLGVNQSGKSSGAQEITSAIDRILGGNVAGISGAATTSWIPGLKIWSGSGQTQSDWNNLKSLLSLEGRQKLKGSGAISDFEAKILEQAATQGIDPTNMSTDEFVRRLNDLKTQLSGTNSSTGTSQSDINSQISALRAAGFSDQEIADYFGGR